MNLNNSYPVKYAIAELAKDSGPSTKGNVWAEPDTDHAASQMRYVFENQDEVKSIAEEGAKFIKQEVNSKVARKEILTRIKNIDL